MNEKIKEFISGGLVHAELFGVYPKSVHEHNGFTAFMADCGERDMLIADKNLGFSGKCFEAGGKVWTAAELNHKNAVTLRYHFSFAAPKAVLKKERTIGTGDRLGIATAGHIQAVEAYDAYPILAQQSIRELNLTNRSFEDVLDCASFSVFREGFTRGFGADGDHLKTAQEVAYAISCGYTMITLDCSEHIRNDVYALSAEEVKAQYVHNAALEEKYIGKSFDVNGLSISFDEDSFMRTCLIYNEAVDFAVGIYKAFFADCEDALDFEISIDETATPTEPYQHYFVARELCDRGVKPATVAPRFCGEFQKGIDYIGDLAQFEKEMKLHAAIAEHFGYKISVHSGSDKFSVFNIVGRETKGHFHLKTAGTSWLEAMKIVAAADPALYREIHRFALDEAFEKATAYYHVTTNLNNIPALDTLSDAELPELFKNNDSRQLIHITYGLILNRADFRERLYKIWREHRPDYAAALEQHIGKHLALVYEGFRA